MACAGEVDLRYAGLKRLFVEAGVCYEQVSVSTGNI